MALLNSELVSMEVVEMVEKGEIRRLVDALGGAQKLGIGSLELFDGAAKGVFRRECCRIVKRGEVEELVDLMGILGGDLVSALNIFEASKQDVGSLNMYIYCTIIDVCGLCSDFLRSRSIYEDLRTQKITPNLYVFNSLMNVNDALDLSYTLQIYKHMQVSADAKMWKMALEIKEDMPAAGVTPNTVTWSSLINACASAGLVEQAILLFEEILLAGCKPNTQGCNIGLDACVEACQYDRAFRLFQIWNASSSKKFYRKDYQGKINIGGDHSQKSYTTNVAGSGSDFDRAHLNKSFPFTPTTATYNILMKACGTDYHHAKALMQEIKTLGLCPNHISWSILI